MFRTAKRTSTTAKRTSTTVKRTSTTGEHRFQTLKKILLSNEKKYHNDFQELCAPFKDRGGTDITSAPPLFFLSLSMT